MKAKTKELLLGVADAMEEGREPFSPARILEMDLPLDELYDLAGLCGRIVRGYVNATPNTRMVIDICSVADEGTGVTPESIELAVAQKSIGDYTDGLCQKLRDIGVVVSAPGAEGERKTMEIECKECRGTGQAEPNCDACEGNGWVLDEDDGGTMTCPACLNAKCDDCGGDGSVEPDS